LHFSVDRSTDYRQLGGLSALPRRLPNVRKSLQVYAYESRWERAGICRGVS
jgi:hypothetical protein